MFVIDRLQAPSSTYLLGTDHFGRDLFARVVYGARVSLRVAFVVVTLTTVIENGYRSQDDSMVQTRMSVT
jgi:ABC-type dipeptide/oligopeptide/nickel transport system permease subunit